MSDLIIHYYADLKISGLSSKEIIKHRLSSGPSINDKLDYGWTPLHAAS